MMEDWILSPAGPCPFLLSLSLLLYFPAKMYVTAFNSLMQLKESNAASPIGNKLFVSPYDQPKPWRIICIRASSVACHVISASISLAASVSKIHKGAEAEFGGGASAW
ncbi:hypothetical protein HDV63DRAFT_384863 [Trichoderma sp. SZMC 28014]